MLFFLLFFSPPFFLLCATCRLRTSQGGWMPRNRRVRGIPERSSASQFQLGLFTADVSVLMKGRRLTHHHLVIIKAVIIILKKKKT